MNRMIFIFVIAAGVFRCNLYGSELPDTSTVARESADISTAAMVSSFKKNPNHIYFGPEIFVFDLDSHFKSARVHGSKFFLGLRLGYEYLKPDAFYFGIDLMVAGANHGFHESFKDYHIPQSDGLAGFANLELRFGYTINRTKWLVTPYFCYGAYSFGSGGHHHFFEEGMTYLGGGVHSRYEVSRLFNIGVNAKVFASIYTDEKLKFFGIKQTNHHGQWGGEIGLPLIWRVGSYRRWDIQLEPYFLSFNFSEVQNIYGLRMLFGYHF